MTSTIRVLLSHDPSHWNAQVTSKFKDIDVAFAGHTHGMQFGVELGNFKWARAISLQTVGRTLHRKKPTNICMSTVDSVILATQGVWAFYPKSLLLS
ncbi:MAG: hypothetical protein R2822_23635 [Spirosomataceae bacterium]